MTMREDIEGLTGYVFETELENFLGCLLQEPLYIEEGIITEEDHNKLCEFYENVVDSEDAIMEIVNKACENKNNTHIYALAHRIHMELL